MKGKKTFCLNHSFYPFDCRYIRGQQLPPIVGENKNTIASAGEQICSKKKNVFTTQKSFNKL